MDARGTSSYFCCVPLPTSAILSRVPQSSRPEKSSLRGRNRSTALRQWLAVAAIALVGCSADGIHSPQKFFPGSTLTNWDECSKFGTTSNTIAICATSGTLPGRTTSSYNVDFFIPSPAHILIAVFDEHANRVKVVFDADEPATLSGTFRIPPVPWDYTDESGRRVPNGQYRMYFKAGDFISTSDVKVE